MRICGQSVSAAVAASSWTAAIAAWSWYGPTGAVASASVISETPSSMNFAFQRVRSWSASGTSAPAGSTRGAASVGQQHQGQQAGDLAVVRELRLQPADEPDRLGRQLDAAQRVAGAGRVPLGEDQVQHLQHGGQPLRASVVGEPFPAQPLLRAADPLPDRRFGDEEGAGDLRRRQATDRAQGERHLRRPGQRRVAAEQQQRQGVVDPGDGFRIRRLGQRDGLLAPLPGGVAAELLDAPPGRRRDQPPLRVIGNAVDRPLPRRGQQGFLDGVLAGVEAAVAPDQRREDLGRELAEQALDLGHSSGPCSPITGRTSTTPNAASGIRAAISTARSWLSQSSR